MKTWNVVVAIAALLAGLAGCGGEQRADDTHQAADQARAGSSLATLRMRALSLTTQGVSPEDAARQLLDFGEASFPAYFPGHKPTQSLPPFLYRFYPETGVYLGVLMPAGQGVEQLAVYVMGGEFGSQPQFVGPLAQFMRPATRTATWLAGSAPLAGSLVDVSTQYYDLQSTDRLGDLIAIDGAQPAQYRQVEAAGTWMHHAQIFAADVDAVTHEVWRLRERWRTYFRNGRLYRLDLEPGAGQVPASSQVSSLSTLAVCEGDQQVFQDWTAPERAVLVFPAPADGVSNCYSERSYRAVRLDMPPTMAPLRVEGRPQAAVRDARGAIEGFIVQQDQRVLLTDASFAIRRVLVDNSQATDGTSVKAYGVHGRGDSRYLLYYQGNSFAPSNEQIRAVKLAGSAAPATLATGGLRAGGPTVVEDASGLYFISGNGRRLIHVAPDLTVRTVTDDLPPGDDRLFLTPTRVLAVAGSVAPTAVVSVPRTGGSVDIIVTLPGNSALPPAITTIGEDVYVQAGNGQTGGGLHIVRSDGSQYQRLERGVIVAPLRPAAWRLDQATTGYDHREQESVFGADNSDALIVIDGYFHDLTGDVVRYDADRARRVLGSTPAFLRSAGGLGRADVGSVRRHGASLFDGRRFLGIQQVGGSGLLQRNGEDVIFVDSTTGVARATTIEPVQR